MTAIDPFSSPDMLPVLRNDLEVRDIREGAKPRLQIYDPLSHRYFDIGSNSTMLLSLWHLKNPASVLEAAAKLGLQSAETALDELLKFLKQNGLIQTNTDDNWNLLKKADAQRKTLKAKFASIIFYRQRLGNPDLFITFLYPFFAPFYTKIFRWITIVTAVFAVLFLIRHVDLISQSFNKLSIFNNAILVVFALAVVKVFHELGHAMQAKRMGLSVPSWGIMFILGFPLPYTELSHGWTLENRYDRARIDAGGILAELTIAVWAALLFIFWPDGNFRTVLFMLAASSLLLSLIVNLNPLMRFDGYFLLSDLTGVKNLQPRSAALGLWALRRNVLGLSDPPPEVLPLKIRNRMIAYSVAVWVYRLTLYIGIALIAYNMLSKVLGVTVFVLEIWFFIFVPIAKELRVWFGRVGEFYKNRQAWISMAFMVALIGVFIYPFSQKFTLPARLAPKDAFDMFAPADAILERSPNADKEYGAGDLLWRFRQNGHAEQKLRLDVQINLQATQIERAGATADSLDQLPLIIEQQERLKEQLRQINALEETLILQAPRSGRVHISDKLKNVSQAAERAVVSKTYLGSFIPNDTIGTCVLRGYIPADRIAAMTSDARAIFIPFGHMNARLHASNFSISPSPVQTITYPEFAVPFGGVIELKPGEAVPVSSWHSIVFETPSKMCLQDKPIIFSGDLIVTGAKKSFAKRVFERVSKVLVRELGY